MANISAENLNGLIKALKDNGFLSTKALADRFYSVNELYEHRLILFKLLCQTYSDLAWKARQHFDGTMFNGSFLAGISTPLGNATYHFKIKKFEEFRIREIDRAPKYDGYTTDEALDRFNSLPLLGESYIDTNKDIMEDFSEMSAFENDRLTKSINELIAVLKDMNLLSTATLSDGNHTLKQLYRQKRELFKLICHNYPDLAWKSKVDKNGKVMSEETFLAGINTPLGPACYVLNDEYFDQFNIEELPEAPISNEGVHQEVTKKLSSIKIRNRMR